MVLFGASRARRRLVTDTLTGVTLYDVRAGDVMVVYDSTLPGWFIRLSAWLRHRPAGWNHIVLVGEIDEAGNRWGMEARPGGVGYVDPHSMKRYLNSRKTIHNALQPKTDDQRNRIVSLGRALFKTSYDWNTIEREGFESIGWNVWAPDPITEVIPVHVICSSYIAWIYEHIGIRHPGTTMDVTPADWAEFILDRAWIGLWPPLPTGVL